MPLQPLDDGIDRKLAHSERLALAITIAPAARSRWTMKASDGLLPASAHEPAVVGMSLVLTLSLTMTGMPSSGRRSPALRARSAARAWSSASGATVMTALSSSSALIRRR